MSGVRSKLNPARDPRLLYLERTLDHFSAFESIRKEVPPTARLLLFRESRGYYLDCDYQWGDPLGQAYVAYARLKEPQSLRLRLAELGITHVLTNEVLARDSSADKYYDPQAMTLMRSMLERYADPAVRYGPLALYRLKSLPLVGGRQSGY